MTDDPRKADDRREEEAPSPDAGRKDVQPSPFSYPDVSGEYGEFINDRLRAAAKDEFEIERDEEAERTARAGGTVRFFGRTIAKSDVFKLCGLFAFFVLTIGVVVAVWPTVMSVFDEGGTALLIQKVQDAGPLGVAALLGMQFLQVVVAFIPGEVVQIAAGMMYGPLGGSAIILVGAFISSAFIYEMVHKLGAPFVRAMVSEDWLHRFHEFERTGKLNAIVFILFLIPGLPKDVFTYIVPLTDMKLKTFLILTTIGRAPGVFMSAYAAADLVSGNIAEGVVIFAIAAALAVLGILFRDRVVAFFARFN